MEAGNPSDEELWEACRKLLSDWEPHGQRRWHGRREDRPDCDSCRWFAELFRTSPDWGTCANPESERAGLLTNREQGCWQHEPGKERRYQAARPARCDFMRGFEAFLREQAAAFIKAEVHRANDPLAGSRTPRPHSSADSPGPSLRRGSSAAPARRRGLRSPGLRCHGGKGKEGYTAILAIRPLLLVTVLGNGHS